MICPNMNVLLDFKFGQPFLSHSLKAQVSGEWYKKGISDSHNYEFMSGNSTYVKFSQVSQTKSFNTILVWDWQRSDARKYYTILILS